MNALDKPTTIQLHSANRYVREQYQKFTQEIGRLKKIKNPTQTEESMLTLLREKVSYKKSRWFMKMR